MPIPKITSEQFAEDIEAGILSRDATQDVRVGPVQDLVVRPQAQVFERQNDRIRKVSLLLTLANADEFAGEFAADLDGIVFNEGLARIDGARAVTEVTFGRATAPSTDLPVQRGYPIVTIPDETSGATVTFVTTEDRQIPFATRQSFFNTSTRRYELTIPVTAITEGTIGRVGPNRIIRPLRPLAGFDSVTNVNAAVGGRGRETNRELIERYLIAIQGRELATSTGVEKYITDNFADVQDVSVVFGGDPLLVRSPDATGAVDAYFVGAQTQNTVQNLVFPGVGQLIELGSVPLSSVVSVVDLATATPYIEGTDFEVVRDVGGNRGSIRAVEGLVFGAGTPPAAGTLLTINYTYNGLVGAVQTLLETTDTYVHGRDLLIKAGIEVPITHIANVTVETGYSRTSIRSAVRNAVLDFINNQLFLGDDVEGSDIQGVVRQISGVDNYVITRLTRSTVASGVGDVAIARSEFSSLADADFQTNIV